MTQTHTHGDVQELKKNRRNGNKLDSAPQASVNEGMISITPRPPCSAVRYLSPQSLPIGCLLSALYLWASHTVAPYSAHYRLDRLPCSSICSSQFSVLARYLVIS